MALALWSGHNVHHRYKQIRDDSLEYTQLLVQVTMKYRQQSVYTRCVLKWVVILLDNIIYFGQYYLLIIVLFHVILNIVILYFHPYAYFINVSHCVNAWTSKLCVLLWVHIFVEATTHLLQGGVPYQNFYFYVLSLDFC